MKEYISRPLKKSYDLGKYAHLYRSAIIRMIKDARANERNLEATTLDFGAVSFGIARHFGFCKGVENAIEMAYEAILQNPDKRVFMVSELIHNPYVNEDLLKRGLRFIKTSKGEQLIPWEEIQANDIVVVPAFGATVQDKEILKGRGIHVTQWDAMCRFVEHVWFRAEELGKKGYTIIVHGKFKHEETQATFSYSRQFAPTIVVKDKNEAEILAEFIEGKRDISEFEAKFGKVCTANFNPEKDLQKVAVVNQTTMLASETAEIANFFKEVMIRKYGNENHEEHVANTKDTLCYATKNNQTATIELLKQQADIAIIIGGRNSSNTTHLVELCEEHLPTYFIRSEDDILSANSILHYDFRTKTETLVNNFLPNKSKPHLLLTSGASCPDTLVERVLTKLLSFYDNPKSIEEVISAFLKERENQG